LLNDGNTEQQVRTAVLSTSHSRPFVYR